MHISMFCTLPLPPPHSIWTIKPVAASSAQDRGVITNTDQNTNTDTNTNTETSRDAIKPVSTSSTLNESDPPLVVR